MKPLSEMSKAETGDILTVCLARGKERYVILFEEKTAAVEAMQTIGRWAADPELSFSWRDAAALSRVIRRKVEGDGRK